MTATTTTHQVFPDTADLRGCATMSFGNIRRAVDAAQADVMAAIDAFDARLTEARTAVSRRAQHLINQGEDADPEQARAVIEDDEEVRRLEQQARAAAAQGNTQGVNDTTAELQRIAERNTPPAGSTAHPAADPVESPHQSTAPADGPASAPAPTPHPTAEPTTPAAAPPANPADDPDDDPTAIHPAQPGQDWWDYIPTDDNGAPVRAASEASVTALTHRVQDLEDSRESGGKIPSWGLAAAAIAIVAATLFGWFIGLMNRGPLTGFLVGLALGIVAAAAIVVVATNQSTHPDHDH